MFFYPCPPTRAQKTFYNTLNKNVHLPIYMGSPVSYQQQMDSFIEILTLCISAKALTQDIGKTTLNCPP